MTESNTYDNITGLPIVSNKVVVDNAMTISPAVVPYNQEKYLEDSFLLSIGVITFYITDLEKEFSKSNLGTRIYLGIDIRNYINDTEYTTHKMFFSDNDSKPVYYVNNNSVNTRDFKTFEELFTRDYLAIMCARTLETLTSYFNSPKVSSLEKECIGSYFELTRESGMIIRVNDRNIFVNFDLIDKHLTTDET